MHRSIDINLVTKIEYAEFKTEADMNLYEIYFINLWKPPLNIDDKCHDDLTVRLPEVEWKTFATPLWEKWKKAIYDSDESARMRETESAARMEMLRFMRKQFHENKITEEEYWSYREKLEKDGDGNG